MVKRPEKFAGEIQKCRAVPDGEPLKNETPMTASTLRRTPECALVRGLYDDRHEGIARAVLPTMLGAAVAGVRDMCCGAEVLLMLLLGCPMSL